MKLRSAAVLAVAVAGATAHASYDLMLIAENPVGGTPRVARFDPVSNRSLGNFGAFAIANTAFDVAVNEPGRVAVLGLGTTTLFDYSTGQFEGSVTTGSFRQSINRVPGSSDFFVGGQGLANVNPGARLSTSGLTMANYSGVATSSAGFMPDLRRDIVLFGRGNFSGQPTIGVYPAAGGSATTSYAIPDTFTGTGFANAPRDFAEIGSTYFAAIGDVNNNLRLLRFNLSGTSLTNVTLVSQNFGAISNRVSLAAGHNGLLYLLNDNVLHRYHPSTFAYYGAQTLPYAAGTLGGMDVVIAPEPGTMIALGAGLAAIARRRRRTG